jgi:hypothetical protein
MNDLHMRALREVGNGACSCVPQAGLRAFRDAPGADFGLAARYCPNGGHISLCESVNCAGFIVSFYDLIPPN